MCLSSLLLLLLHSSQFTEISTLSAAHPSHQHPTDGLFSCSSSFTGKVSPFLFWIKRVGEQQAAVSPQKQGNKIRRRKLHRGGKQLLLLKRLVWMLLEQQFHQNWMKNITTFVKMFLRGNLYLTLLTSFFRNLY